MSNVDVKDLMQPFSQYLYDNYKDKLVGDSNKFINDFVADMNTDKFPEICSAICDGKYDFPVIDCLFFIKYYFNYIRQKFDFFHLNFKERTRERLNCRALKEYIDYYNNAKDRIVFDKLNLSRDELRLPSLKLLEVRDNATIANYDPDDMITVRASYAPMYYYAQEGDVKQFYDWCRLVAYDDDLKKAVKELREFLIQNKIKVIQQGSDWVQFKGKQSSLIKLVSFLNNHEFGFEPFYDWMDSYDASVDESKYNGHEIWYWDLII